MSRGRRERACVANGLSGPEQRRIAARERPNQLLAEEVGSLPHLCRHALFVQPLRPLNFGAQSLEQVPIAPAFRHRRFVVQLDL